MINWNYTTELTKSNGYEPEMALLKTYTKDRYLAEDAAGRERLVDEVFNIYRTKNVYPIMYYNHEGIIAEIKSCMEKKIDWDYDSKVLNFSLNQGQSLCRFLFPNLNEVVVKGVANNSPYYKFFDDEKLKKAIRFCFDYKTTVFLVSPSAVKDGLEMTGGNATNFKTMNAKALYEHFCQPGDTVLDFSAGFGGRLLGATSAGLDYIGIEPNTETVANLNKLIGYIREANPAVQAQIIPTGSEVYLPIGDETIDFAFSSPPYFDLEVYSDEETQSVNKFKDLDPWLNGYAKPTIQNIYDKLKPGKYYAVNIADFKSGKTTVQYVDKWIEFSQEVGFEFVDTIYMKLTARPGLDNAAPKHKRDKKEGIFVFRKPLFAE